MDKNIKMKLSPKETVKVLRRAIGVSVHVKNKVSLFISILGFAMAFMPLLISSLLSSFTNQIQLLSQNHSSIWDAISVLLILACAYSVHTLYKFAQDYYFEVDAQNTELYIRESIMNFTSQVEYKYIENEGDFRDKLLIAEQLAGYRVVQCIQKIVTVLQCFITLVSVGVALYKVSGWIVLLLLVTSIPAIILSSLQSDDEYMHKTKWSADGHMVIHLFFIAAGANEQCRSLTEVRFRGIFQWVKAKWRTLSKKCTDERNAITRKHVLYNSIADIFRNVVYIGVLYVVAAKIYTSPEVGLGIFMLAYTLSSQFQEAANKFFVGTAQIFGSVPYMKDFFDLQDTPKETLESDPKKLEKVDIEYRNVSFSYPNSDIKALEDINISIKQGEKIAIVGENGSGKSTFINLLCGLYEPTKGEVEINGKSATKQLSALRRAISVVFQNFTHYETTIRENITISNPQRMAANVELLDILRSSGAYECVESQPNGLDEVVGTFSRSGNNLSGGQWQKLAMGRALYRDKARVMILDEPTAALDPLAEAQLYRSFADLMGDRTAILISHRLGITSVVDRILVFKGGSLIGDGSHDVLMQTCPYYAQMYHAQVQWYQTDISVEA